MTTKTNPAPKAASVKAENIRKAPGNVKEVTEKLEPKSRKEPETFIPEKAKLIDRITNEDETRQIEILEKHIPATLSGLQLAELNEVFKNEKGERATLVYVMTPSNTAWVWMAARLAVLRLRNDESIHIQTDGDEYHAYVMNLRFDREYFQTPRILANALYERIKALASCFEDAFTAIGLGLMTAGECGIPDAREGYLKYFARLEQYADEINHLDD
jgi:hypothetical protein